ncbi:MAG: hypothetical protein KBA67_07880 [Leptotrichiaceae bacterium]|jgi:transcriptional regulator with XRE-family HTH domain|nr:hypothetical protein [Leptotrichiaceae bacterium]
MNKITTFDKKIATNITKLRKKFNISVEQIAEYLYIDSSFVRSVECFDKKYNLRHLFLIKDLFEKYNHSVTFEDIFPERSDSLIKNLQNNTNSKNKA